MGLKGVAASTADLEALLLPFVSERSIDQLASLLAGLSADRIEQECARLAQKIVAHMSHTSGEVGPVERAVVITSIRAAALKASAASGGDLLRRADMAHGGLDNFEA